MRSGTGTTPETGGRRIACRATRRALQRDALMHSARRYSIYDTDVKTHAVIAQCVAQFAQERGTDSEAG